MQRLLQQGDSLFFPAEPRLRLGPHAQAVPIVFAGEFLSHLGIKLRGFGLAAGELAGIGQRQQKVGLLRRLCEDLFDLAPGGLAVAQQQIGIGQVGAVVQVVR